jgi:hypothetical protein
MNLPEAVEYIKEHKDDPKALADCYAEMHEIAKQANKLKRGILDLIGNWMHETGVDWGETEQVTFGITNPNPRSKVNEKRWQEAVENSEVLAALEEEYNNARKPFLEDATQPPRPYIRKKRG